LPFNKLAVPAFGFGPLIRIVFALLSALEVENQLLG
jgi:hypothetical protein